MMKIRRRRLLHLSFPGWTKRLGSWLGQRIHNMTRVQRIVCASLAGVIILSATIPVAQHFIDEWRYKLDGATLALVGTVNKNLAAKLTYDKQKSEWQFNKSSEADTDSNLPPSLTAQAGGSGENDTTLYRTTFPRDPKKGVTFTDAQTDLAFTMTPKFDLHEGRDADGRLVYPMKNGAKLIYSAKNNGMKEDIVIPKFIGKELQFSYKLNLPSTLEAKILDDSSVGIFSADPILFGEISTASDMDAEKLKSAREQGEKNHLLFAIPAPVIVQSGEGKTTASARFGLSGDTLTVTARDMDKVQYPVSVDPSVVVTSTSDFMTGNNEDSINYETDQINRSPLTGGAVTAGWTSTASGSYTGRFGGGAVAYNGYLYNIGGVGLAGILDEVNYAPINSNGTIGAWGTTTALPSLRHYVNAAAYNGRMYVWGGYTSGTSALNTVIYATINSNGTLGSWTSASNNMATAACRFGGTIHDGYIYAAGGATGTVASNCGNSSATMTNTIQYAPILANGDVGSWTTSGNTFTNARKDPGLAIYNGYAYVTSGTTDGVTTYRETQIANVGSDGSIGTWRTATELLPGSGKYRFGFRAYNGYLYVVGGTNNSTGTLYAPILANGEIGAWNSSSTLATGRYGIGLAFYKGYAYYYGGNDGAYLNDTYYAKVDGSGIASSSTSTTAFGAAVDSGTDGAGFMYNGYLYYAGGHNGTDYTTQVRYAAINSSGTVGTWNTTSALTTPITGGSGLGNQGYAIYNNRIYMIGGKTTVGGSATDVNSIQYASFNSNGTLSSWTLNGTNYTGSVSNQPATAYNGYMYMMGNSGSGASDRIYRAQINSNGTVGSWTQDGGGSNNLSTSTSLASMITHNKYLYVIGGNNGSYLSTVQYAPINSDGTLGIWSTTTAMSTARSSLGVTILNGYLYAIGGETAASTYTAVVEYAPLNSNGTVGSWSTSTSLAATAAQFGVANWNDTIYVISGRQGGSRVKTVLYIKARSGGGGTNGSWTTAGNTFTTSRYQHAGIAFDGYLYVIGGIDSSSNYLTSIQYAPLNDDGSVGTWNSTTAIPAGLSNMGAIVYGNYLYLFGGKTGASSVSSTVYAAAINSNGTLGTWNTTTSLPNQLHSMATVTRDGYVYLLGGTNTSAGSTVLYASLSSGSVGSWSSTTSFTGARNNAGAVVNGNYLYLLGGDDGSSNYYKDVQYTTIHSNGTLDTWSNTTDMNFARSYIAPTVLNGFLYINGGFDGTNSYNRVEYAPFNSGGTIGSWKSGTSHTNNRYGHAVVIYRGFTYLSGGYNGSYYNNVQYSALQSTPRTAVYSKLYDLSALYSLFTISYAGSLPGGTNSITYRTAGTNGILGNSGRAGSLDGTSRSCSAGSIRYVFVTVKVDDATRSVFPEDINSTSYLTSLTTTYTDPHAPTDKRLAHGKFFDDEVLQPLDTCGA